jgi:uncharacterized protein YcbK (DUF882 family)
MKVRVLSALVSAVLVSLFANAAQARVETASPQTAAYGDKIASKPNNAKNYKATSGLVYALATTSDVAIGATRPLKPSYTSKVGKKKHYTKRSGKGKSYASRSKGRKHYASRAITAGRDEGGTSRSCLQSSTRALLNRIEARFGSVNIISTCRSGAVIATSGKPSKHRYGLAVDFSAPGRKAAVVQWLIANHHSGGTMTYRDMDHIHVDVGYHFVSLGANSGRG